MIESVCAFHNSMEVNRLKSLVNIAIFKARSKKRRARRPAFARCYR